MGKNTSESTLSPPMVETMALSEKFLPLELIFILLIIKALTVEPLTKAIIEAIVTLGASEKM